MLGYIRDSHFHWHSEGIHNRTRQRDHEEHKKERKPLRLECSTAPHKQDDGSKQPDDRSNLEKENILRTTDDVQNQAKNKNRPASRRSNWLTLAQTPHIRPLAIYKPAGDDKYNGTMRLLVGSPDTIKEIYETG